MSENKVQELRLTAIKKIAEVRGISPTTVSNKFRRELKPDIKNTYDFDRKVWEWLASDSNELKRVLLEHATNSADTQRIRDFFHA